MQRLTHCSYLNGCILIIMIVTTIIIPRGECQKRHFTLLPFRSDLTNSLLSGSDSTSSEPPPSSPRTGQFEQLPSFPSTLTPSVRIPDPSDSTPFNQFPRNDGDSFGEFNFGANDEPDCSSIDFCDDCSPTGSFFGGGGSVRCTLCSTGKEPSADGRECIRRGGAPQAVNQGNTTVAGIFDTSGFFP